MKPPRSKPPVFHALGRPKRHPCGCRTVWDEGGWRSVALSRCDAHAPLDPNYTAETAPEEGS